jgi:hypothetical protein
MASAKQIAANRLNARLASGPKTQEGRRRSAVNARKHGLTQPVAVTEFGMHLPAIEALLLRDGCDPSQARELALCILDYERNVQHLQAQFEWSEPQGLQLREPAQAGEADFASAREVGVIVSQASMHLSRRDRSVLNGLAALQNRLAKRQVRQEERTQRGTDRHYRRAANQLLKCLRSLAS